MENSGPTKDPRFIDDVRDISGYIRIHLIGAIVLSLDEESGAGVESHTAVPPLAPGVSARRCIIYCRPDVISLFAALNVATGETISKCDQRHRHQESLKLSHASMPPFSSLWKSICARQSRHAQNGEREAMVHAQSSLHRFTPRSGNWLNLVKRLFADVAERWSRKPHRHRSVGESHAPLSTRRNRDPKLFVWTADIILGSGETV